MGENNSLMVIYLGFAVVKFTQNSFIHANWTVAILV